MAIVDMVMPKMGESVQEGTVIAWKVKAGDKVEKDQILLDIATDKVDTEVPAPASGVIAEILVGPDQTVEVGTAIARIDTAGGGAASGAAEKKDSATAKGEQPKAEAAAAKGEQSKSAPKENAKAEAKPAPKAGAASRTVPSGEAEEEESAVATAEEDGDESGDGRNGRVPRRDGERFYSPLVRGIAEKQGVSVAELRKISGSGRDGRVTKDDLQKYLETRGTKPAKKEGKAAAPAPAAKAAAASHGSALGEKKELAALGLDPSRVEVQKMNNMRKRVAQHMVESVHTSPHVFSVHEIDMTPVADLRNQMKDDYKREYGSSLTFTSFIIWAACRALRQHPWVNARINGDEIILHKYVNFGMAVALPENGLIVPVIRDCENLTVAGVQRKVNDLAERARSGKLEPDDMAGGTFTLTNMGSFGTMVGLPIISQPQVAILGCGSIDQRAVIRQGGIAVRSMMYATLAYDHRLIDGAMAANFLNAFSEALEQINPPAIGFDRRKS